MYIYPRSCLLLSCFFFFFFGEQVWSMILKDLYIPKKLSLAEFFFNYFLSFSTIVEYFHINRSIFFFWLFKKWSLVLWRWERCTSSPWGGFPTWEKENSERDGRKRRIKERFHGQQHILCLCSLLISCLIFILISHSFRKFHYHTVDHISQFLIKIYKLQFYWKQEGKQFFLYRIKVGRNEG